MMRKARILICIAFFMSLAFAGYALFFIHASAATDAVDSCCAAPIDTLLSAGCEPANVPAHRVIVFDTASAPGQGITPPCCEVPTRPRGGCCPGSFDLRAGLGDILFSRSGMFYEEQLRLLYVVDSIFRPPEI